MNHGTRRTRPVSAVLESLETRINEAWAHGLGTYDRPRLQMVARLCTRARQVDSKAARRLGARAEERLAQLWQDYRQAKEAAQAQLERLCQAGRDQDRRFTQAFHRSDFVTVQQASRRYPNSVPSARERWKSRLSRRLQRRRPTAEPMQQRPDQPQPPTAPSETQRPDPGPLDLAEQLYAARAREARASHELVALVDALPAEAGMYNSQSVATRTLWELGQFGTPFLRTWLEYLDNLSMLKQLPDSGPKRPPPKRKRSPAKRSR